jgi:acyl-CoA oxidase
MLGNSRSAAGQQSRPWDDKVYEDMFHRTGEPNSLNKLTIDPYPDSPVLVKQDEREKYKSKL